eukprot:NODE_16524_length_990_cov_2.658169.p1 GENE.NODE_16524_length_990_cov_2.658169~~NODE_16524_length_990_cov_2.658169.p1  ORF type:complete len:195 (-),score=40.86 NODE_16524_length_990_cov_2.658169:260-844(-)
MPPFWATARGGANDDAGAPVLPSDDHAKEAMRVSGLAAAATRRSPPRRVHAATHDGAGSAVRDSGGRNRNHRGRSRSRGRVAARGGLPRHALPAAVVQPDVRADRSFANRHIVDKRRGAISRAEELRQQILRGTPGDATVRGRPALSLAHEAAVRCVASYPDCGTTAVGGAAVVALNAAASSSRSDQSIPRRPR